MSKQVKLKLLSVLGSDIVMVADKIVIPGEKGEFSVLYGHANFVAKLKIGVVRAMQGIICHNHFIYNGIATVNQGSVTIISEFIRDLQKSNVNDIKNHIMTLKDDLASAKDDSIDKTIILEEIMQYESFLDTICTI
ncbi:hypothetical protein [Rickettsia endosymbiont of Cardiosporidium cionae]|uniref:hypothetical protein n=1 Tax=Rickettsia endosymbiont of Cardiosporidium cionae TaxID=2777155 RepID=UPI0018952B79|nr:hypothetical protein [Rickettsia endosymbiont of Cardiosporidium cionae]